MTEEEYAAEVAYQRLAARAAVTTLVMQMRLDVLAPHLGAKVRYDDQALREHGHLTWIVDHGHRFTELVDLLQPLVEQYG